VAGWLPFSPLFLDLLMPWARTLLSRSRQVGASGDWKQAEQIAQEAQKMWRRGGDWFGCAAVLISLAQACQEGGKPDLAYRYHEAARRLIARQISPSRQVRQALTTYAAALFNQLIGSTAEAQRLFHDTVASLERAASRGFTGGDERLARRCRRLAREVAEQADLYAIYGSTGATPAWIQMPGASKMPDPSTRRFLAELETLRYLIEGRLRVGDKSFRVYSVDGEETEVLVLKPGEDYFVVEAPPQTPTLPAAEEGDYLLLRQADAAADGAGASSAEMPGEAGPGEYTLSTRDEDGRAFTFQEVTDKRYAHLVGGTDAEVISVLKLAVDGKPGAYLVGGEDKTISRMKLAPGSEPPSPQENGGLGGDLQDEA
jgi:hypothetical protein